MLSTTTRMVNLEVVVKDSKGNHIKGLVPMDFQIFEQTPSRSKEKREQQIADFKEVHVGDLPAPPSLKEQAQPGVYANALAVRKDPVPPTILLVDGLNTEVQYQAQVHVQMLKMLRQLPTNVPVAVFLLGDRMVMLQSFTTDPKLLQAALSKVTSPAVAGLAHTDAHYDANAAGNMMGGLGNYVDVDPGLLQMKEAAQEFDQKLYAATMDEKVKRTIDALISLGHHVAGYPGRKNLLWLSTTFPLLLSPNGNGGPRLGNVIGSASTGTDDGSQFAVGGIPDPRTGQLKEENQDLFNKMSLTTDENAGGRTYWSQIKYLGSVLSDAKISVYPVNVAGVQTLNAFQASAVMPKDAGASAINGANTRQSQQMGAEQDTMDTIAAGTGGIVCTGDNDLAECVRKAVEDSSDFYEISYYPDSPDWNGEFRKVMLKADVRGAHLSYRQGYFATPEGTPGSKIESMKLQSDCDDYIDSTAVQFSAKSLPPDAQGALRFALTIDATPVTFTPTLDGGHAMHLAVAACTFNEEGWVLNLMSFPSDLKLDAKQFATLTNTGRLSDVISVPGPRPAAVRLLVKDVPTGKLGSIYIKMDDAIAAAGTH
jgi:VWFA-related protein